MSDKKQKTKGGDELSGFKLLQKTGSEATGRCGAIWFYAGCFIVP